MARLFDKFEIVEEINAANGHIFKCKMDGVYYFIKRYNDVMFGASDDSPALRKKREAVAGPWLAGRKKVMKKLKDGGCGNGTGLIVYPQDYLVDYQSGPIYAVNRWIEINNISMEEIGALSHEKKIFLFRIASHALKNIHDCGIIHNDLKPDNIPISQNAEKKDYICKITDLDDAQLAGEILFSDVEAERVRTTPEYESPEMHVLKSSDEESFEAKNKMIDQSSDIFSLGLVFHEWWSGKKPGVCSSSHMRQVVFSTFPTVENPLDGKEALGLDPTLPDWLSDLITDMLSPGPLFSYETSSGSREQYSRRPTIAEVKQAITEQKWSHLYPKGNDTPKDPKKKYEKTILDIQKGAYDILLGFNKEFDEIQKSITSGGTEFFDSASEETLEQINKALSSTLAGYKEYIAQAAEKIESFLKLNSSEYVQKDELQQRQMKFKDLGSKNTDILFKSGYEIVSKLIGEISSFSSSLKKKGEEGQKLSRLKVMVSFIVSLRAQMFKQWQEIEALQRLFAYEKISDRIDSFSEDEAQRWIDLIDSKFEELTGAYRIVTPLKENYESARIETNGRIYAKPKNMQEREYALIDALRWGLVEYKE